MTESKPKVLRRVAQEARPFRFRLATLFVLSALGSALTLLVPVPLKIAVDSVLGSQPLPGFVDTVLPGFATDSDSALLLAIAVLFVLIALLIQAQQVAVLLLSTDTGQRVRVLMRSKLFRHLQRLSLQYHDTRGTLDSSYRIQWDATAVQHVAVDGLLPLVTAGMTVIGMIVVTALIDWQLALVAMAVAPVMICLLRLYGARLKSEWHDAKQVESSSFSVVHEALGALRVVKAFGREQHEEERFVERSTESVRAQMRVAWTQGVLATTVGATIAVGTALVLYIGVRRVQSGGLTLGELLLVMTYLTQLYEPLRTIAKKIGDLQAAMASAERVFTVLDEQPDIRDRPGARPIRRARGAVEFEHVAFGYENERPVLRDINLEVSPGMSVGIAGTTGAGKTTLISLLTRFYDPTSGRIRLDGRDLRELELASLRNQFAIVLQEPVLFSTTIGENISYGRIDAGYAGVVAAAKAANADAFISALPDAYDTPVGERGMTLSGGERQRIALARAFLKDAPIMILDEPTSSVDVKTEAMIMDAMNRLMAGRTTFMIAHRLSTLELCDLRVVLEHGQVVETTTRSNDSAMATGSKFDGRILSRVGAHLRSR
ncbi:MAG: Xenobiotic-transporting ATPase [Labilithrix sp.]|jgi:ATP-binding cassette subfamily B protein|nr:Xenobiotic-transporting ATPase [Labilithrix sp.]